MDRGRGRGTGILRDMQGLSDEGSREEWRGWEVGRRMLYERWGRWLYGMSSSVVEDKADIQVLFSRSDSCFRSPSLFLVLYILRFLLLSDLYAIVIPPKLYGEQ